MSNDITFSQALRDEIHLGLDELARRGAQRMLAARVHDKRPIHKFTSSILPPYMRKSPRLEDSVPILYL